MEDTGNWSTAGVGCSSGGAAQIAVASMAALMLGSGCVTSATTLQEARTVAPGDVRVSTGVAVPLSTAFVGEVADLVDAASDGLDEASATGTALTEEQQREAIESAAGILLLQPAPVWELSGRIGLVEDIDVGLRWAGPSLGAGLKWRFLSGDGYDMAAALDYAYHTGIGASIASRAYDLFDALSLVDYSRHDVGVTLLASGNADDIAVPYGSLRYLAGITSLESQVIDAATASGTPRSSTGSVLHHLGGTAGARIGTPNIHVMIEISLMYLAFEPTILGVDADLNGWLITPAIGLGFET